MTAIEKQMISEDELIVVDDHSTDQSLDILERHKSSITKLIHRKSNQSRGYVRNEAAKEAQNEVLVFIDSDVIIGPETLLITRQVHEDEQVVGASGNMFGGTVDVAQFEWLAHISISDFLKLLENDFSILHQFPDFFDGRYQNPKSTKKTDQNWINYYTGFASVTRKHYQEAGGFDAGMAQWGAEDVDFGYRLNLLGPIVFLDKVTCFHHPHSKNYRYNLRCAINNIYHMLKKYKTFQLELLSSFETSRIEELQNDLFQLFRYIARHNQSQRIPLEPHTMLIEFPSAKYPVGRIRYRQTDGEQSLALFGFAIPFSNQSFKRIILSKGVSLIPESLLCMVFQEALRVSEVVLMEKTWIDQPIYRYENGFPYISSLFMSNFYISCSITDFQISAYNEDFLQIKWSPGISIQTSFDIKLSEDDGNEFKHI